MARKKTPPAAGQTDTYKHPEATSPLRPDVGMQAQFKKTKPARTYKYDSSLSPALEFDDNNPAREQGEALIREILEAGTLEEAKAAAAKLKALGKPFLNWTGKAEHFSFEILTLPLFIHERTPRVLSSNRSRGISGRTRSLICSATRSIPSRINC